MHQLLQPSFLFLSVIVIAPTLNAHRLQLLGDLRNVVLLLLELRLGRRFTCYRFVFRLAQALCLLLVTTQLFLEHVYFGSEGAVIVLQRLDTLLQRYLLFAFSRVLVVKNLVLTPHIVEANLETVVRFVRLHGFHLILIAQLLVLASRYFDLTHDHVPVARELQRFLLDDLVDVFKSSHLPQQIIILLQLRSQLLLKVPTHNLQLVDALILLIEVNAVKFELRLKRLVCVRHDAQLAV